MNYTVFNFILVVLLFFSMSAWSCNSAGDNNEEKDAIGLGGGEDDDETDSPCDDDCEDNDDWKAFFREMNCRKAEGCPDDMVGIICEKELEPFCIDKYEASKGSTGEAVSAAGVLPWNKVTYYEAKEACQKSGKRLCDVAEWVVACAGPNIYDHAFADEYIEGYCNAEGIEEKVVETGKYEKCEGGYAGLFDMLGNVMEIVGRDVPSYSSYLLFGGTYESPKRPTLSIPWAAWCAGEPASESVSDENGVRDGGFRCCKDLSE